MINFTRIFAIFRKEIFHVMRDPFSLIIAIIMPVVMVLMFGSAIEFNVRNVPTAYVDQNNSQSSRLFLRMLGSSEYFKLIPTYSIKDGYKSLERENARALIVIPPKFEDDLLGKGTADIQILLDGTDNSSVGAIAGYIGSIQTKVVKEIQKISNITSPVKIETRFLFNPELNSQWFIVPALTAVIMAILSLLLTSLTISKEWENGSMELLLSTPIRPLEIVIGKIVPYALLGVFAVIMVYVIARTIYHLPFVGSYFIFGLGTLLFLLSYLGLGLFVSTAIRNQQAAVQAAMSLGLMPAMLFSGFLFPLEHMPVGFRYVANIFPARWYVDIVRDQFLKGSSFFDLILPFSALFLATYVIVQICVLKFKGTLEK